MIIILKKGMKVINFSKHTFLYLTILVLLQCGSSTPCPDAPASNYPRCAVIYWHPGIAPDIKIKIHTEIGTTILSSALDIDEIESKTLCYNEIRKYYESFSEVNIVTPCWSLSIAKSGTFENSANMMSCKTHQSKLHRLL